MFSMLTKNDREYINKNFDQKFEQLAIMIQNGFAECVSKNEFNEVREDISDIKKDIGNLKNEVAELRFEVYSRKSN